MLNEKFLQRMKEYLKDEYEAFISSYNNKNIRALTINENVITKEEFENIFDLKISKIPFLPNSYYLLEDDVKIGFHPLHHAGAFYMQDPSASCVVESIDIPENFVVLDLCAAPGGKSIQLAQKLKNGVLFANEIDNSRAKILYSNIERMCLNNVVVTNNKPSDYLKNFEESFDLILVDAPCSGEGMFRKYPESQELWSLDNVNLCSTRDREILDIAYRLLKKDGILLYSTCTFAKEENEDIIEFLVNDYGFTQLDIKDTLKSVLKEGFIPKTYRFYPHLLEGEGQFLAILKKNCGGVKNPKTLNKKEVIKEYLEFEKTAIKTSLNPIIRRNLDVFYSASNYDLSSLKVLNFGVKLGELNGKRFVPNHNFYKAFSNLFNNQISIDFRDEIVRKYLHGEQIQLDIKNGFGVLKINNIPLGGFKASNQNLNNHYPKGLRNF